MQFSAPTELEDYIAPDVMALEGGKMNYALQQQMSRNSLFLGYLSCTLQLG